MAATHATLERLRKSCMALPDVTERPSHGMPAFFVGKKQFAVFSNDHHGDGRVALVCAGTLELQQMLVDSEPDVYYRPPYVGHQGWLGVRLDRKLPWTQVVALLESAHALCVVTRRARAPRP